MKPIDYAVTLVMSVILIIGIYQFYFWCQRNHVTQPRELKMAIDDLIPYRPGWVWIYSCLYYPVIVYINFVMQSPRQFLHVAMSFVILLAMQMTFFLLFPVITPEAWRANNQRRDLSERFLAFVQSFDGRANSFPSMHVSVATLTALHLMPNLGMWAMAFPLLIGLSCLFTKQHYLIDLPAGAVLGGAAFWCYQVAY
ncbi:MAG TPA: phosphatase PAP2 family protein [Opitutaceae bacterium]|nr:phosphatase PAP2 family protein [Opitutaceae bacterium]HND61472.1 phosphatase PAP2 family protein [Opitutaceae bacterium]